jgi:hypothetical protein
VIDRRVIGVLVAVCGLLLATSMGSAAPRSASALSCAKPGRGIAHHRGGRKVSASPVYPCVSDTGDTALEPTLGVTAKGVVLYQAARPTGVFKDFPDVLASRNGGRSWKDVSPTMAGMRAHPISFDPFLYVDRTTSRVFTADAEYACNGLSFSDDGGQTWTTSEVACGGGFDHQSIFTGKPVTSTTTGYPNVVYDCIVNAGGGMFSFATVCHKSLDGGMTFMPTGQPAFLTDTSKPDGNYGVSGFCDGLAGRGTTGPSGTVYLAKGFCGQPTVAISHDEGATWTRVQIASNGMSRTRDGRPDHEVNVAVDRSGNVFAVWSALNRRPYLAVSRDGGRQWSAPMMIGPPRLTQSDRPDIDALGTGKILIGYIGSQNAPAGPPFPEDPDRCVPGGPCPDPAAYRNVTWNGYMAVSSNALARNPVFETVTINDPLDPVHRGTCGPGGCFSNGDGVSTVAIAPSGVAWGAFIDRCPARCSNGEEADAPKALAVRLAGISLARN